MKVKKSRIKRCEVKRFIREAKGLQNFDFMTNESGIYNLYFTSDVDKGKPYSQFSKIVLTRGGFLTLFKEEVSQ